MKISDAKKNREKILCIKHQMCDMDMSRKVKVMKLGYSMTKLSFCGSNGRRTDIGSDFEQKGNRVVQQDVR